MSDELNVWREAYRAWLGAGISDLDQAAAAVIRDYGDKRYQQAIADVVEWLGDGGQLRDFNRILSREITRRFGKDA